MDTQNRIKQFAAVQTAKTILKILPRISEQRLLQFPIVKRGLEAVSYYPEGKEFLKSLLLHGRRAIGRCSRHCLAKFAENLIVHEFIAADPKREEFRSRHWFYPPFLMVISPSMRCNMSCYGCNSGQYDKGEEITTAAIHRVLSLRENGRRSVGGTGPLPGSRLLAKKIPPSGEAGDRLKSAWNT